MSGYRLQWRGDGGAGPEEKSEQARTLNGVVYPVDGGVVRPDVLGALEIDAVRRTTWRVGRTATQLGDWFTVSGSPGLRLVVAGAPRLDRLGAGMTGGELVIEGDAGDHLGASMSGGLIRVTGSAGSQVGGADVGRERGMTGGEIVVAGDAGPEVGRRMRLGLIAVLGSSGPLVGRQMFAGTIVVHHGALIEPGLNMRRGTIVTMSGRCDPLPGFAVDGVFPLAEFTAAGLVLRRLAALGVATPNGLAAATLTLWSGDRLVFNKGELWQLAF